MALSRNQMSFSIYYLTFANSIWKCNEFSELSELPLAFAFGFHSYLYPVVGAVGTVGNATFFWSVFQALWEQWKNGSLFFHGFHSAAVSIA